MKIPETLRFTPAGALKALWRRGPACRNGAALRLAEGGAALLSLAAIAFHVFRGTPGDDSRTFLIIPPLLWVVLRFGPRGALLGTILIACASTAGTTAGLGPFFLRGPDGALRYGVLLGFITVETLCSMVLASLVDGLRRAQEELNESRRRLDSLFKRVPGLVWTVDREMRFTSLRGTLSHVLDAPAEKVLGQSLFDFFGTRDPSFPALAAHREAMDGRPSEYRQPWVGRVFHCHVDPLLDGGGNIVGVVGMAQDVTDNLEAEEERHLSRKMDALARLAGRVAHDLNNALTAILGFADLLLADFPPEDPHREDVQAIEKSALRAAVTADLLTSFSPHSMNESLPVDLNALVQALDPVLGEILGPKIARMYRLEPGLSLAKVDPAQLRIVLRHLASNARDAMPEGGQLMVSTQKRVLAGRDWVRLSMRDTGPGFSDEARTHLFEPYYTTRSKEKDKGLGLATCYGLVRRNGGLITAQSVPGQGAAFHLDFPLSTEAPVPTKASAGKGGAAPGGTETVLLVEDEDPVRAVVSRALQGLGYGVLVASGGDEAILILEQDAGRKVRLLVSDVSMPGMTGVELARRVAERRPDVRRLLMSGYAEKSLVADGTLPPGTAFIQKPFPHASLARRLRDVLDAPPLLTC